MTANVDAMVREGIKAYRAGSKNEARALLLKAVELDQYNEQAWLWLSATVDSPEEQRTCLENVLVINPNNERAKQGIQALSQKLGGASVPKSAQLNTGSKAAGPFAAGGGDELPTSLEWDMPATETSSPSTVARPPKEPSAQEYDDWVSSLNLGTAAGTAAPAAPANASPAFTMTPFTDENMFGMDEEEADSPASRAASPAPFAAPPSSAPRPVPHSPVLSPSSVEDDPLLADIESEVSGGGILGDDFDEEDEDGADLDPKVLFQHIPAEIVSTRVPGTDEKYPPLIPVGVGVLSVLNLLALVFLIFNLIS